MGNLLDTHTFLWFINGDIKLSTVAKKAIENLNTPRFVSIASIWEISIKVKLNKLLLHQPFDDIEKQLDQNDIQILPIRFEDIQKLNALPFHHKDPFDRIIISQAITQNLTIITKDESFTNYDVKLLW
jgi:PIN domain nuclease of toxin-antitoxin system